MFNSSTLRWLWLGLVIGVSTVTVRAETRTFRVGFFEGGPYEAHAEFRNAFRAQIKAMTPPGVQIVFEPDAFYSAEWNREKSKSMAREIAAFKNLDLIVATGPWTVEDLLAAGFDRPIVAAFRFDPVAEGLVNAKGRPIIDNLTVRVRPKKVESDLLYLANLVHPDTVGVLYFPSGDESAKALDSMRVIGRRLGFEIVTAQGFDTDGAYAYFKAYRQLSRSADAVYLLPLWGCEGEKIKSFYQMIERDRKAAFSSEGMYHVERGALASGSAETAMVEAHLQAWKVMRIIQGMVPADLPITLDDDPVLTLNDQVARSVQVRVPSGLHYDMVVVEGLMPDSVERVTLVDAISVAVNQNPGFQATYQTMAAAGQAAKEARSSYLPQLELNGSAAYFNNNAVNNDPRYDNNRLQAHLSLRQDLFALDAIRDIRTAALQRDQSGVDQKRAQLDLELAVTLAYLDLAAADRERLIEQANRSQANECLEIARVRLSLGETEAVDVWRAEQELMSSLQALRAVESRRQIARTLFNTLLGRPPDYPFVADLGQFSDERFANEQSLIEQLTGSSAKRERLNQLIDSLASANSPEAKASDLDVAVQKSQLSRTNAGFWPRIGFFADFGVTDQLSDKVGYDEANPSWTIGAEIKLPLFLGGRRLHERSRMRLLIDQETFKKDQVSFETVARVRVALEKALSSADEFAPAARADELAKQVYPEMISRYSNGEERMTDLLDAIRTDREASLRAVTAQINYYRAAAEAVRAAGISTYESGKNAFDEMIRVLASITPQPAKQ